MKRSEYDALNKVLGLDIESLIRPKTRWVALGKMPCLSNTLSGCKRI